MDDIVTKVLGWGMSLIELRVQKSSWAGTREWASKHSFLSVPVCRCPVRIGFKLLPLWSSKNGLDPEIVGKNKPLCCFLLGMIFVCFFFISAIKIKLEQNSVLTRVNTSLLISSSQTSCLQFLRGMLGFSLSNVCSTEHRQEAGAQHSVSTSRVQSFSDINCSYINCR